MSGCLGSMLTDIEVAVGDTTKDAQYFISQGLSRPHIKNARVAWICLTESMTDTDLLDKSVCQAIAKRCLENASGLVSSEISCYTGQTVGRV